MNTAPNKGGRPMTSTPRVQALRDRRKASGLSEVRGIWAPPDQHQRIKEVVRKLPPPSEKGKA